MSVGPRTLWVGRKKIGFQDVTGTGGNGQLGCFSRKQHQKKKFQSKGHTSLPRENTAKPLKERKFLIWSQIRKMLIGKPSLIAELWGEQPFKALTPGSLFGESQR